MKSKAIFFFFFFFLVWAASGCAPLLLGRTPAEENTVPLALSEQKNHEPYRLQIDDEVFDGARLYVKVRVIVKDADALSTISEKSPDIQTVVIRVRSVANGVTVGESFLVVPSERLQLQLQLSVEASGFTDYQADLLWGQDAKTFLRAVPPSQFITVKDVSLVTTTTRSEDGKKKSTVTGTLVNEGVIPLSDIPLSLELQWVNKGAFLDLSLKNTDAMTDVNVTDAAIAPGESRVFSIAIDADLAPPHDDNGTPFDGDWQAIIRVRNNLP